MDKKKELLNFLLDIDCLSKINSYASKINIFNILKTEHTEIRHSNMLAWLLNTNEKHGLGDVFIRNFLNEIIENNKDRFENINISKLLLDSIDNFTIYREYLHIDILLINNKTKQLIAIENKIYSTQHDNQLNTYKEQLDLKYPEFKDKILLYLTPNNSEDVDDSWIKISYALVLNALKSSLTHKPNLDATAKLIIDNYIEIIERYVMNNDDEIRNLCLEIYNKHKSALDLIFEYKPDEDDTINSTIVNCLKENKDVILNDKYTSKFFIRFTTPTIEKLVPNQLAKSGVGWGNGYLLMYEIVNDIRWTNSIKFKISLSDMPEQKELKDKIYNIALKHDKELGLKKTKAKKWVTISCKTLKVEPYTDDFEGLCDATMKALNEFVTKDIKKFETILSQEM